MVAPYYAMKLSLKLIRSGFVFIIAFLCFSFSPINTIKREKTEIVFCLDLSASTNGLLNDIRDNLWQFINNAKDRFPNTDVRIGIVVFARPSFGAQNNYVKILSDITEDYDLLSYHLFSMQACIEKGDQCNGSALYTALKEMHWSKEYPSQKMIYLFGNGSIQMCGIDYHKLSAIAFKNNIPISMVYCEGGKIHDQNLAQWNAFADSTKGDFNVFKMIQRTPSKTTAVETKWLDDLNERLQDTYIYYSREGKLHFDLMVAADKNSKRMEAKHYYSRCYYKLTPHFIEQCGQWDLISLMKTTTPDFSKLNRNYLPPEFQSISPDELKEIVQIKSARRDLLINQMKNAYARLNIGNLSKNPIDSILMAGIN